MFGHRWDTLRWWGQTAAGRAGQVLLNVNTSFDWLGSWFHSQTSSASHLFRHQHPELLPAHSLFALLKSKQAQRCSFRTQCLPTNAEASSSASEKVNQRGSAGLLWPERRAFAPTWRKMSVPTGAPFTPAKWWFFPVQRSYQADSCQEVNKSLPLCFTAVV